MPSPPVIGLLGGVAAGKSTAAACLARRGAHILDADAYAAEALAASADRVEEALGTIDREELAEIVFRDEHARGTLESILHPLVRAALEADLAGIRTGATAVLDVPLLLERGLIERCDRVIFVDAPEAARRERSGARGWTADDWARRESAQADLATKREAATHVVANDGSPEDLDRRIGEIWDHWQAEDNHE